MKQPTPMNYSHFGDLMFWGIVGYMALFILRPWEYKPELQVFHLERLWIGGLLFLLLFYRNKKFKANFQNVAIGMFSLTQLLSVSSAVSSTIAWNNLIEYLKVVIFYLILIVGVNSKKDLKKIILTFLIIMFIYQGKSVWEYVFHGANRYDMSIRRLTGIDTAFGGPNVFAATIVYSLPFAFILLKGENNTKKKRGFIYAYFLLSITCIILTGSRGGQAGFLFFTLLSFLHSKLKLKYTAYASVLLIVALSLTPQDIKFRFYSIFDESYDFSINKSATVSAQSRIAGLKDGYRLFLERPILGWGPGNFAIARGRYGEYEFLQAHNMYGQLMAELGLLGILSFSILIFSVIINNRNVMLYYRTKGLEPDFFYHLSIACTHTIWLLLFEGLVAHNLYLYTWLWVAAFSLLNTYLTTYEGAEVKPVSLSFSQKTLVDTSKNEENKNSC